MDTDETLRHDGPWPDPPDAPDGDDDIPILSPEEMEQARREQEAHAAAVLAGLNNRSPWPADNPAYKAGSPQFQRAFRAGFEMNAAFHRRRSTEAETLRTENAALWTDGGARAAKRRAYKTATLDNFKSDFCKIAATQVKAFKQGMRKQPTVRSVLDAITTFGKTEGHRHAKELFTPEEIIALGLRDPRPRASRKLSGD